MQTELIALMRERLKLYENNEKPKSKLDLSESERSINLSGARENLAKTHRYLDNEVFRATGRHLKGKNYLEVLENLAAGDYKSIETL